MKLFATEWCRLAAFVGAVVWVSSGIAADAADSNCQLKKLASVPIQVDPGRVVVPVTINGSPVRMLLDVSNGFGMIRHELWKPLSVVESHMGYGKGVRVGSKVVSSYTTIASLKIGTLTFSNLQFLPLDLNLQTPAAIEPNEIVGNLGLDMFTHVDMELDFAHGTMNLFDQGHCPGHVVYWAKTFAELPMKLNNWGNLYFPIELDGVPLEATIATIGGISILREDAAKAIYGFDHLSPGIEVVAGQSGGQTSYYRAMTMTTKDISINHARLALQPDDPAFPCPIHKPADKKQAAGYPCEGRFPVRIGLNVLTKLHLYLATKEKKLYFTTADAAPEPVAEVTQ